MHGSASDRRVESPNLKLAPPGIDEVAFEHAMLERWPQPTVASIALRVVTTGAVFAATWRAIQYQGATMWSLLLPLAGEIVVAFALGLILAIFFVRDPKFRAQVFRGVLPWIIIAAAYAAWQVYQGHDAWHSAIAQLDHARQEAVAFIAGNGMYWAMLAAAVGMGSAAVGDVAEYRRRGPPFVYLAAINLGLRLFVMFVLGFWLTCLLFAFDANRRQRADAMWFVLLIAEIAALWMPAVVVKKIRAARAKR